MPNIRRTQQIVDPAALPGGQTQTSIVSDDARNMDLGEAFNMTPTSAQATATPMQRMTGRPLDPDHTGPGQSGVPAFIRITESIAGVPVTYLARKTALSGYRMPPNPGEHIDVVVPDADNEMAADMYIEQMLTGHGHASLEMKDKLKAEGLSSDTLHISGNHYHFEQGKATPVHPDDVVWLEQSTSYLFKRGYPQEHGIVSRPQR